MFLNSKAAVTRLDELIMCVLAKLEWVWAWLNLASMAVCIPTLKCVQKVYYSPNYVSIVWYILSRELSVGMLFINFQG